MTKKEITEKISDYFDDASEMLPKDIDQLSEWFRKKEKQEKVLFVYQSVLRSTLITQHTVTQHPSHVTQ